MQKFYIKNWTTKIILDQLYLSLQNKKSNQGVSYIHLEKLGKKLVLW